MERYIFNGGLEQGIFEFVDQDGLLSEKQKQRLEYLKSLPQNRYEFEKDGQKYYKDLDSGEVVLMQKLD